MGICGIKQLLAVLFVVFFFIMCADEMRRLAFIFFFLIHPQLHVHLCRDSVPISVCAGKNLLALASIWL